MTDSGQIAINGSAIGSHSDMSSDSYNDGNWHYVVAVGSSDRISLYVDGQLVAVTDASPPDKALGSWVIGNGYPQKGSADKPSSDYFAGTVSDAAFYDTGLGLSQIQAQFQASSVDG
jgi:hypothetical protein